MTPTLQARAALPDAGRFRYAVGAPLGRGGMAVVFGSEERDLQRPVAVKVMEPGCEPARFLREAQVTAQLEHPNIPPVHDIGMTADGRPFFTMKVVEGRTGAQVLRDRPSMRELLQILLKACDAIAFAHSRGVVHRDLKPANLMVGEFGEILVMDWGLARVEEMADLREGVRVAALGESMDGAVVGTPSYMAPEQARGEPVDERADVFALGAILYEILAGVPPYRGHTVMEVLEKAREGRIEPPAGAPELAAIAMKALAPDRESRYATVEEFQRDVRRFLEGREVSARRDPPLTRAVKWVRRNPIPTTAMAAVLVALGIGASALRLQATSRARDHERSAESLLAGVPAQASADRDARRDALEALVSAEDHLRQADAPERRFEANLRLGEWALAGQDYALARLAFSTCRSLDARRAEGLDRRVTDEEERERRRQAARLSRALADIASGFKLPDRQDGDPLLEDYQYEIVGFRDDQTVRMLGEALEPYVERAARDGKEAEWTDEEKVFLEFCFEMLGRVERPSAVGTLTRALEALWDDRLAAACGIALCNTRRANAQGPLLAARDRIGLNSGMWRQVARFFARVPDPEGQAEPRTAAEFNNRGLIRRDKRDFDGAIEDYTRAIELDPKYADAFNNRGNAHEAKGDNLALSERFAEARVEWAGAIVDWEKFVELEPSDPRAAEVRGWIAGARGKLRREEDF